MSVIGLFTDMVDLAMPNANAPGGHLLALDVLDVVDATARNRRFFAPSIISVLSQDRRPAPET